MLWLCVRPHRSEAVSTLGKAWGGTVLFRRFAEGPHSWRQCGVPSGAEDAICCVGAVAGVVNGKLGRIKNPVHVEEGVADR